MTFFLALLQFFCLGTGALGVRMSRPVAVGGLFIMIPLSVFLASRFRRHASEAAAGSGPQAGPRAVWWIARGRRRGHPRLDRRALGAPLASGLAPPLL